MATARTVTLVVDEPRGRLPPLVVESPWWQEAEPVVAAARHRFGLEVVVLRLLSADPATNAVRYHVEVVDGDARPLLHADDGGDGGNGDDLDDHGARLPWARPGGPAADLAWAAHHVRLAGAPVQVRTWNLSSVWRLPTEEGPRWLKHVPPFFAHEAAVIDHLASHGARVPRLVAADGARMVLADVGGPICHDATAAQLAAVADAVVDLGVGCVAHADALVALGAPAWRGPGFVAEVADVVAREAPEDLRRDLEAAVLALPGELERLGDCGLPDTLVHGDAHPGNVAWAPDGPVVLDWGDAGVGHPLLDLPAFLDRAGTAGPELTARWLARWRRRYPRADTARAVALAAPIAALRHAVVYRRFLDAIEPTEHVYHRDDPKLWLRRAAAASVRSRP
jgi:Ser/Thr protein kinase RdoA (MazF antagonist)